MWKCVTLVVRWCRTPQPHINFATDNVFRWYMSRWTCTEYDTQELTVICFRTSESRVATYTREVLNVMKKLWIEPQCNLMDRGQLATLLETKTALAHIINKYDVAHGDPDVSFYNHVNNTVELLKRHNWTISKDQIVADSCTMFQMYCKHVSS